MTGPEHYRQAETRITAARNETDPQWALIQAQLATAEATLALAAATALAQPVTELPDEPGYSQDDYDAWYDAIEIGDAAKGGAADA